MMMFFFFFQAEDGIRDKLVTGVQTCALPISLRRSGAREGDHVFVTGRLGGPARAIQAFSAGQAPAAWDRERFAHPLPRRSEERRVGKEGRSRRSPNEEAKKAINKV